jgi:sugar lactone lactonase YvrE
MNVTCPKCGHHAKCGTFYAVQPNVGKSNEKPTEKPTDFSKNNVTKPGMLCVPDGGRYSLKIGRNTVGRRTANSAAMIQIPDATSTMSRSHAIIDVEQLPDGRLVHIFQNDKNMNDTFINDVKLEKDDRIVLTGGEAIKMGKAVAFFMLADS